MRADLSAENSIIGAVLIDERALSEVIGVIDLSDFGSTIARKAFEAILSLRENGELIDPVTVLQRMGDTAAHREYVLGCMDITPTAANIGEYCKVLKAQAKNRKLDIIADAIREDTFIGRSWHDIASDVRKEIDELGTADAKATTSKDAAAEWLKLYNVIKEDPGKAYCRTCYKQLDKMLGGGFFNGEVYILAGRPGMGKTTQGIGIAEKVAGDNRPVLFISLEMSETQIMAKRIAIKAGVGYTGLLSGKLDKEDETAAILAAANLSERPFYIADRASTVKDIERYAKGIEDISLIVVDYLGLIRTELVNEKRYEEMTRISADLKAFAKRINKPILVLAQLNRENTQRSDKRPTMADLRDSGAIEQDAAGVILLHRESYYKPGEEIPEAEEIELIIAKNRHAAPGTLKMMWHGRTGQITEFASNDMPF